MNEIFGKHPTATWLTIIGTLLAFVTAATIACYYMVDERERSMAQSQAQAEIRHEQEKIRRELQA